MDGRFQQHQSDSFSIANLLSMQPKHHQPHRPIIHPEDPLSHLRKLTTTTHPDAANSSTAETNALLAIHHQQQHHYPYYCNNPALASTSSHPPMMSSPTANPAPEGFNIKAEETMLMNNDPTPSASGEQSSTDPASIDSADSGKLLNRKMFSLKKNTEATNH